MEGSMKNTKHFALMLVTMITLSMISTITFAGEKPAASLDMTGTWKMDVQTSLGNGKPTFVLKQVGNVISGTYQGAMGSEKVTGEVNGMEFTLNFTSQGVKVKYIGTVTGNDTKGIIEAPPFGTGSFKGQKAKKK